MRFPARAVSRIKGDRKAVSIVTPSARAQIGARFGNYARLGSLRLEWP